MSAEAADFMDDICRPKIRDAKFCVSTGLSPLSMMNIIMDYIRCLQK